MQEDTLKFLDPKFLARLSNLELVARLIVEGFISGLHRSPYQGFSVEFSEHREYTPGDDLKYLDWKVYGKRDKFYIKRFQEETNMKAYVLLDTSASMGYASQGITKFQYGAHLAASLSYLMTKQRDSVGLLAFSDRIVRYLPARSGSFHLKAILETLGKLATSSTTDAAKSFHYFAETVKRRGLIIVISDLFDEPMKVMQGLMHFRHNKHEVMIFHLLDRFEIDFPYRGLAEFQDMETGAKVMVFPEDVRDEYLKQLEMFIKHYRKECADADIEYIPVDTSLAYSHFLLSYLSRRSRLF